MKTIYESESTPKKDGFYMPGEYEEQGAHGFCGRISLGCVALWCQAGAKGLYRDY